MDHRLKDDIILSSFLVLTWNYGGDESDLSKVLARREPVKSEFSELHRPAPVRDAGVPPPETVQGLRDPGERREEGANQGGVTVRGLGRAGLQEERVKVLIL